MAKNLDTLYAAYADSKSAMAADELFASMTSKAKSAIWAKAPAYADDIAQDAVLAVWKALDSYDPTKASFSTWFSRIVDRTLANHLRGVYRDAAMFDHDTYLDQLVVEGADHDIDVQAIREAAGESNYRLIDLLLEGCTYAEAAEELGCTPDAVKFRIQRIRDRVRR